MAHTSKSHKSRKTQPSEPGSPESSAVVHLAPPPDVAIAVIPPPPTPTEKPTEQQMAEALSTGAPQELPKEKQYWYRTVDSKTYKVFQKIIVMREAGRSDADIAKRIGTTTPNVAQTVWIAKKNGWLDAEGDPVDIEAELAVNIDRKVVRNISASLDGQMTNWQTHEMTLAAAKGRGHFKNHEVSKGEGAQQLQVVAIQVVMPAIGAGDQMPEISEEQMGGVPAYVDGEVSDGALDSGSTAKERDTESRPENSLVLK